MDYDSMDSRGISTGDIVEIAGGKSKTVAKCLPLIKGDKVAVPYFGGMLTFVVIEIIPDAVVLVTRQTVFHISREGAVTTSLRRVSYEDIGGLRKELQKVREMIELPLSHPEIFEKT